MCGFGNDVTNLSKISVSCFRRDHKACRGLRRIDGRFGKKVPCECDCHDGL